MDQKNISTVTHVTQKKSLADFLLNLKEEDRRGVRYIDQNGESEHLSYRQLYTGALEVLGCLQEEGIQPGDELVFQVEDSKNFCRLFWAAILGGMIPIPLAVRGTGENAAKIVKVLQKLHTPTLCTDSIESLPGVLQEKGNLPLLKKIIDLGRLTPSASPGTIHTGDPEDIALIQYSSGSTGDPKGIVLTHRNLLANIEAMMERVSVTKDDLSLSWMPLTHDMGLIGFHLGPVIVGIDHIIMQTSLFIRRPTVWLDSISRYRATLTGAPNFGMNFLLKDAEMKSSRSWDLSSLRILFCGAEPIDPELCEDFTASLAPYKLQKESLLPVYGLAEASLGVAFPRPGIPFKTISVLRESLRTGSAIVRANENSDADRVTFIGHGTGVKGCRIKICDDSMESLPAGSVGKICIKGPNVTSRIYNDPEKTSSILDTAGWLTTGDLGFFLEDNLYITGREREIIFINGQNYFPHDLERVIERTIPLLKGKVAVTGIYRGHEQKIAACIAGSGEDSSFLEYERNIKKCVLDAFGLTLSRVMAIPHIPTTSSGKKKRWELEHLLDEQEWADRRSEAPLSLEKVEQEVVKIIRRVIENNAIGLYHDLGEYDLNSLTLQSLHHELDTAYRGILTITDFFRFTSPKKIADYIYNTRRTTPQQEEHPSYSCPFPHLTGPGTPSPEHDLHFARIICLAAYMYLFSEFTEDPLVSIYIEQKGEYEKITLDFSSFDYLEECCAELETLWSGKEEDAPGKQETSSFDEELPAISFSSPPTEHGDNRELSKLHTFISDKTITYIYSKETFTEKEMIDFNSYYESLIKKFRETIENNRGIPQAVS